MIGGIKKVNVIPFYRPLKNWYIMINPDYTDEINIRDDMVCITTSDFDRLEELKKKAFALYNQGKVNGL